jgi:Uma2 family endonuclease
MTIALNKSIALAEFLQLPETKPASEYINGEISQKPMPRAQHSRLQGKLTSVLNAIVEPPKIAYAFPELRCTFGGRSIVPDVAVFRWQHIEFDAEGEPVNDVFLPPDWTIEILSPEQRPSRVIDNILHCLQQGSQMGWLIDPDDRSVLIFLPKQEPRFCEGEAMLIVPEEMALNLTAAEMFGWLRMS